MSVGAYIVNNHELFFDAHDKRNGSLYLAQAPGLDHSCIATAIEMLRTDHLWSVEAPKQVADTQKSAYAEQMVFMACREIIINGQKILAARFTHTKFPSDEGRWNAWLHCLS